MRYPYIKEWDFKHEFDDTWEAISEKDFSIKRENGILCIENFADGVAPVYLRPCSIYGDRIDIQFAEGHPQVGTFTCGFLAGFEYINITFDFKNCELKLFTHEFHKQQPRYSINNKVSHVSSISIIRNQDILEGLPYEGSQVQILINNHNIGTIRNIDFLPESLFMLGLKGKGKIAISHFKISGPLRPRPEYLNIGIWQQSKKPTTEENVDALIEGVKRASENAVQILVTPETSLTGLRIAPELYNRQHIQEQLLRFQKAVSKIKNAPYVLIGYPEWIPGRYVEGATLDSVRINCHRFVRPDGTLGPVMAKVHSCEEGLWHGRNYNLQRVCGTEVAVGVCHDGHYQDVWAIGVMGGARLCLHPSAGGKLKGNIKEIVNSYRNLGENLDAFWVRVNAGGGSAIVYPCKNRKQPDTILAVCDDLTEKSPTYPEYSNMGDLFAHARIRLWDATGCYPMRTLRNGWKYNVWKQLIPDIQEV
ncbi:MAG TPA: nitrilase-related carbon-nitrogen hydrolase [bacterium]|nr:nitrilase-related carbon-nitrogen hydrolase [bacterium]HOL35912.1 nitrilase-related carbon-nitrogen hydrolase [bacterium]HPP08339.1 nitrilase-related carbon-nitrogen hydrolase [bacterium]